MANDSLPANVSLLGNFTDVDDNATLILASYDPASLAAFDAFHMSVMQIMNITSFDEVLDFNAIWNSTIAAMTDPVAIIEVLEP
jgi:hypothetical protein